jgi:acyl carrier protein
VEQWDSLRHMNLVVALEEEFRVRFTDQQIDELLSLRLILLTLKELGATE